MYIDQEDHCISRSLGSIHEQHKQVEVEVGHKLR